MRVVLCNCPVGQGTAIAQRVVQSGWAACVNVIPAVRSVYRWKGEVVEDEEETLLIKVAAEQVEQLKVNLGEIHPYETPEFVVIHPDMEGTSHDYVAWVRSCASGGAD